MKKTTAFFIFMSFILLPGVRAEINTDGFEMDSKDEIKGVKLSSGKKKDLRLYTGKIEKDFNVDIDLLLKAVLNFEKRCNNEEVKKRKLTPKNFKCEHHNSNLIESLVVRDYVKAPAKSEEETDQFLVLRRIYNRELFHHTELVRVFKEMSEGKKRYRVAMQMLPTKFAKKLYDKALEKESAFKEAHSDFLLEEIAPGKTKLLYTYSSSTDHWLINKSIAAGEVFESVSKSLRLLFEGIEKDSVLKN